MGGLFRVWSESCGSIRLAYRDDPNMIKIFTLHEDFVMIALAISLFFKSERLKGVRLVHLMSDDADYLERHNRVKTTILRGWGIKWN